MRWNLLGQKGREQVTRDISYIIYLNATLLNSNCAQSCIITLQTIQVQQQCSNTVSQHTRAAYYGTTRAYGTLTVHRYLTLPGLGQKPFA